MRYTIVALALLLPLTAIAAPADDTWMRVMLDGRKIGDMHTTRNVKRDHVITTQTMNVQLDRSGTKVALTTSETDTETRDGKPLAFESHTTMSGIASVLRGTLRTDGKFDVVSEVGGAKQTRVIDWPQNALLAEGQRLSEQQSGLVSGSVYKELAFQTESLDAVEIESTIGAREHVDLPDGDRLLTKIEQNIHLPGAATSTFIWVDEDQNVFKMTMPIMGYELTMLACTKTCAQAPNQSADILTHSIVQAPTALSSNALREGLILNLSAIKPRTELQFATTDEQLVSTTVNGVQLHIEPLHADSKSREEKPTAADSQPNDWLQSAAPEVIKLAHKGAGDAKTPREQMQRLEQFVRSYIRTKDLNVGYASALEVVKNPEGDCTEHAVLLAALGRALGIPTRVVDGLAYTDRYAGGEHVFVPHAWAQAYVDDRWQSFDAALHGFDAGHIALSVGDGDPWRFFAGFDTLGSMRVDGVEALPEANSLSKDSK